MILVLWLACVLGQDPGTTPVSPDPATPARPGHVALITAIDTVEVPAREMGILKKIHVREGENVAAGQLLQTGEEMLSPDRGIVAQFPTFLHQGIDLPPIGQSQSRHASLSENLAPASSPG